MPRIDIPNNLEYSQGEAFDALIEDVDGKRGRVRRELAKVLRDAALRLGNAEMVPDASVSAEIDALRQQLVALRVEHVRLGRVRDNFVNQRVAAAGRGS